MSKLAPKRVGWPLDIQAALDAEFKRAVREAVEFFVRERPQASQFDVYYEEWYQTGFQSWCLELPPFMSVEQAREYLGIPDPTLRRSFSRDHEGFGLDLKQTENLCLKQE